jgi:hypothetical protein
MAGASRLPSPSRVGSARRVQCSSRCWRPSGSGCPGGGPGSVPPLSRATRPTAFRAYVAGGALTKCARSSPSGAISRTGDRTGRGGGRSLTAAYRQRNVIERAVGWLKERRRIATRYEKLAIQYLAMLSVSLIEKYLTVLFANTA